VIFRDDSSVINNLKIPFPLFVKPTDRGGGLGIDSGSFVQDEWQLIKKLSNITKKHQSDALIEQYLPGREFSVSILKKENEPGYHVMPIELMTDPDRNGIRILTSKIKEQNSEKSTVHIDNVTRKRVCDLALDVFQALGARDYGRIDVRLDDDGYANFLEANLVPSLKNSPGNYFPKACKGTIGLDYNEMILLLARLGLQRNNTEEVCLPEFSNSISAQLASN
ncbi:MAG: hypothetical protein LC639_08310, partial [Idiomarina sp.]|nr:hypothetical protein [Idiomarina sp.]